MTHLMTWLMSFTQSLPQFPSYKYGTTRWEWDYLWFDYFLFSRILNWNRKKKLFAKQTFPNMLLWNYHNFDFHAFSVIQVCLLNWSVWLLKYNIYVTSFSSLVFLSRIYYSIKFKQNESKLRSSTPQEQNVFPPVEQCSWSWHIPDKCFHFDEATFRLKSLTQYAYWFYDIWLFLPPIWHLLSQVIIIFLSVFPPLFQNALLLLQISSLFHIFQTFFFSPHVVWLIKIMKLGSKQVFPGSA